MHLQRTQTRSIIEEDWGAVERLERAVVLHVELPEIQARGQLNPEVVCGLSRSQRQVGDNFESLDEPNLDQEFTRCLPVLRRALADVLLLLVVTGQAQRLRVALERRLWPCAGRVKRPEERRPVVPDRNGELGDVVNGLSSPPAAGAAASSLPAPWQTCGERAVSARDTHPSACRQRFDAGALLNAPPRARARSDEVPTRGG